MSTVDTEVVPSGAWQVDKVHSSIGFAVDYMAGTFHGTFSDFDAVVADGVLNGSAKVASVQVKDENPAAHCQCGDILNRNVLQRRRKLDPMSPSGGPAV